MIAAKNRSPLSQRPSTSYQFVYLKSDPCRTRTVVKGESGTWVLSVSGCSVLILASLFFLIVFDGNTYLAVMTNDTFVYFDGIHRLNSGQLPHKDFHTALGSVAYLIPYFGYRLTGGYAGSLELASFLVAAVFTLISIVLLHGRTSVFFGVLTIAFLALLAAVPMNVGTLGNEISHAMFYNRWGWAALVLVLVTYISPDCYTNGRLALEAFLLAFLIIFLLFLKITYFIFALAFLFLLALKPERPADRRLAAGAILISLVFWGLAEWQFSVTRPYLEDLRMAMAASGAIRNGLAASLLVNLTELLSVIAVLYVLASKRELRWHGLLYVIFVTAAGLVILNQNFQPRSVVIILAVLLWSYSLASRNKSWKEEPETALSTTGDKRLIGVLLIVFLAPHILSDMRGIVTRSVRLYTGQHKGKPLMQVAGLERVYISETFSDLDKVHEGADPFTVFNEARAALKKQELSQGEYLETINSGVHLLESQNIRSGKIITFDLANPFNFLTRGVPSRGDYSWFHADRSISTNSYKPPEDLFQDVNFIMVPTIPMTYTTTRLLWQLYGEYIERQYVLLARNKYWTLYKRPI
jgi:hypothetical protein